MRDWKALAVAIGAGIPPEELDRVTGPLVELEQTFRPLAESLTFADEPATVFSVTEPAE